MLQASFEEQVKLYKDKLKQEEQEERIRAASRTASLNALSRSASQATLGPGIRGPSKEGVAGTQAPGSSLDAAVQEVPGSSPDAAAQEVGPAGSAEEPVARDPSQLALGTRSGGR